MENTTIFDHRGVDYKHGMILVRSDHGDGGWSLHAPGSTDDDIACGDAPPIITGKAKRCEDGVWDAPTMADVRRAAARLARAQTCGLRYI